MKHRAQSNYSNRLDQLDFNNTSAKIDSQLKYIKIYIFLGIGTVTLTLLS